MRAAHVMTVIFLSTMLAETGLNAQAIAMPLDSGKVSDAIKTGLRGKDPVGSRFETRHLFQSTGFAVFVQGPYDRIATAAGVAAKNYGTFTVDSVSGRLATAFVTVTATPWRPVHVSGKWSITPLATRIVLVPKIPSEHAVQPTTVDTFPVDWSNALGGQFHGQGATAYFPADQLPAGDFDIVIITDTHEYRISISGDERKSIH